MRMVVKCYCYSETTVCVYTIEQMSYFVSDMENEGFVLVQRRYRFKIAKIK